MAERSPTRCSKLEDAVDCSTRAQWVPALAALRAAWLAGPHPRLSPLARAAAERVQASPVVAKREREVEAKWLELARAEGASALPTLTLSPWPRLPRDARARVEALAAMPRDVLVGAAISELMRNDPYGSTQGAMAIRRGLRVLFGWKDPLATQLLTELGSRYELSFRALRKLAPIVPWEFDAEELELVRELDALLGTLPERARLHAQLLAEVYARPGDDGPRAVLADALTEAADPRGEFISLQLAQSDKGSRRERELLRAHGVKWLGELGPFVLDEPARVAAAFSRGFVSRCWLNRGLDASVFARSRAWATVEELSLAPNFVFASHENLRALRSLQRVEATTEAPIPPLELLTLHSLGAVSGLPFTRVETLGLISDFGLDRGRVDDALASVRRARWFESVKHLRLPGGVRELAWAFSVLANNPGLLSVELSFELVGELGFACQWGARLGRDGTLRVTWEGRNWSGPPVEEVAVVLGKAPLEGLARLEVVEQAKLTKEQRSAVSAAFDQTFAGRAQSFELVLFGESRTDPSR